MQPSTSIASQILLFAAWLIALIATLTTLYAGEILHMPVCPLCWYQRIGLYPLALILGIACYREDKNIYVYGIPLAGIAGLFALYQYLEQMIPGFAPIEFCSADNDCSQTPFKLLGFVTFSFLSLMASLCIISLLVILATINRKQKKTARL